MGPNNSFKPNLLRYTNSVAGRACHVVGYATQVGLTQALAAMDRFKLSLGLVLIAFATCATAGSNDYIYFPSLAQRVLAGDSGAFQQVLAVADTTSPGEQLEELAELSARFVRLRPSEFLRAQATTPSCFGVSFLGAAYVDNPDARAKELGLRRMALESVTEPALAVAKQRCLRELAGS